MQYDSQQISWEYMSDITTKAFWAFVYYTMYNLILRFKSGGLKRFQHTWPIIKEGGGE